MSAADALLPFTGNPLDRVSEKRADTAWLASARADPRARILPFRNSQPLLLNEQESGRAELGFMENTRFAELGVGEGDEIFLGLAGEIPHFARDISSSAAAVDALAGSGRFQGQGSRRMACPLGLLLLLRRQDAQSRRRLPAGLCQLRR
jgi:NAD+ diphosphatase